MSGHRRTDDLLVRPYAPEDAPALLAAVRASVDSLAYWLPWCHPGYALSDAQTWIAHCLEAWRRRSEFPFGVFGPDGQVLGGTGLNHVNAMHRIANIGYWVAEPHRNRGVATQAAAMAAAIGFGELGFVRLEIVALESNRASQRVAEKLGATRETVARNRLMFHGRPANGVVYSLVPGDLDASTRGH